MLSMLVIINQFVFCYKNSQIFDLVNFVKDYLVKPRMSYHFSNLIMLIVPLRYLLY